MGKFDWFFDDAVPLVNVLERAQALPAEDQAELVAEIDRRAELEGEDDPEADGRARRMKAFEFARREA